MVHFDVAPSGLPDNIHFVRHVGINFSPFRRKQKLPLSWHFLLLRQADTKLKKVNFQIWELKQLKKDLTWLLICREDIGKKPLISQSIEYSDFPIDYIRIWVIDKVALLPSEY